MATTATLKVGHRYLACADDHGVKESVKKGYLTPSEIQVIEESPSRDYLLIEDKNKSKRWYPANAWFIIEELTTDKDTIKDLEQSVYDWLHSKIATHKIELYLTDDSRNPYCIRLRPDNPANAFIAHGTTLQDTIMTAMKEFK
jgi:hypothetical protein